jgi:N-acetylneuraminic acid mutarotase
MPTARSEITATSIEDNIYVIGGFDGSGEVLDIVEVYNANNDSWNSIAPLPEPLHHTAATSFDGKIYVIGGFVSREWIPTNKLFVYDPIKDQWSEGKSMPTSRGALSALFVNGILYAIGGQDEDGDWNTNESYNPTTNNWSLEAPMPTGRHHTASATIDNKIYLIGGRIVGSSPLVNVNTMEKYDTKTEYWIASESMPSKRSGIGAAAVDNSFFVFGGEDLTRTFGNNEKYDTKNGKWVSLEPMPTPRHGLGAVSVDNRIFVIGGGAEPGLSVSNINEVYSVESIQEVY